LVLARFVSPDICSFVARRLRVQYEGAIYHVINRGNYRRDVFETAETAKAFEATLAETCVRFGWRLHAHVVMRNHYHLAVGTPRANLVDGMHWLQSTFATRFNRFRSERGHLFQGRYQALLIEDAAALGRVANYIHLNPARAGIVPIAQVAAFRWSSLPRFLKSPRPAWLVPDEWRETLGFGDTPQGWRDYVDSLIALGGDPARQDDMGFGEMSRGWAIEGAEGVRPLIIKFGAGVFCFA
jgi:REP element-mobilizing transposase RayT